VATETRTILIDDLDGTEGARTYTFAWGSQRYEVDLTDEHRNDMLRALEPYINAARKVGGTSRSRATS
jgi:Lsr2